MNIVDIDEIQRSSYYKFRAMMNTLFKLKLTKREHWASDDIDFYFVDRYWPELGDEQ